MSISSATLAAAPGAPRVGTSTAARRTSRPSSKAKSRPSRIVATFPVPISDKRHAEPGGDKSTILSGYGERRASKQYRDHQGAPPAHGSEGTAGLGRDYGGAAVHR